jgi:hypothetical protein
VTTQFQMTQDTDGVRTLTFIGQDGSFHTINSNTLGFDETLNAVLANDVATATAAAVPLNTVAARLAAVDPAFGTDGDTVTRNGKSLPNRLSDLLLSYARQGSDSLTALGQFITRLDANPSRRSVDSLFDWIDANNLSLTADGLIVGYKGVSRDDRAYKSVHSGTAFVNGVMHKGQIPNAVGDVITMPRNEVQDDPNVACHYGLHVGSHGYASGFGQHLLTVTVDPADVVSVPTDCGAAKMRVCRYTVVAVNEAKGEYAHAVVTDFDAYSDSCDCGCHD